MLASALTFSASYAKLFSRLFLTRSAGADTLELLSLMLNGWDFMFSSSDILPRPTLGLISSLERRRTSAVPLSEVAPTFYNYGMDLICGNFYFPMEILVLTVSPVSYPMKLIPLAA